jgi:hypothetical protein
MIGCSLELKKLKETIHELYAIKGFEEVPNEQDLLSFSRTHERITIDNTIEIIELSGIDPEFIKFSTKIKPSMEELMGCRVWINLQEVQE